MDTVIIHDPRRTDRGDNVAALITLTGATTLEAIIPEWESGPANVAVRGCSLAHLRALRLHTSGSPLVVLEDDAEAVPAAYDAWLQAGSLPEDCGAILLGGDVEHYVPRDGGWYEVLPPFWGTQAVAYNIDLLRETPFLTNAYELLASNQMGPQGNGFGLCYESVLMMALHSVGLKLYCRHDHAFTTLSDPSARSGAVEPPRYHTIKTNAA